MFQWVKPRGSTLYEGLGAMLLLPVKWPRLTGAIGTGLQRRHIACGGQCHMKPIPCALKPTSLYISALQ